MNCRALSLPLLALSIWLASCSDEPSAYPPIITNLADAYVNDQGVMYMIETDYGQQYLLTNPQADYAPGHIYRTLSGYVPTAPGHATLYQMSGVYLLHDSTATALRHATPVVSAWRAGRYINLHLAPLTQGGVQYWGFTIDSVSERHTRLGLHHNQNADPCSFTRDVFASIPVDSIPGTQPGDTLSLTVPTPAGPHTWTFVR